MKYQLYITHTFGKKLRAFLKKHPELEKELERVFDTLIDNPFNPVLKTHKLKGKLKNHYAVYLTFEYRILFVLKGEEIYLTNIGTHEEVY